MNTSSTALMTVDEAREWAESIPDKRYELHDGQLVEKPPPTFHHKIIQKRLYDLLTPKLRDFGEVYIECPYRGTPEYDIRSADIGVVSAERHRQATELNNVYGGPDLSIEVLSPSNRPGEMKARQAFCFAHGTQSFWIVNPIGRTVRVITVSGQTQTFGDGDLISLEPFAADSLAVSDIFA